MRIFKSPLNRRAFFILFFCLVIEIFHNFGMLRFLNWNIMSLIKYIERVRRMDSLISMMATGTPEEFAGKLGIRRSTLFLSLQEMREMGVDIKYSCTRQSYYYADNRRIKIKLECV